MPSINDKVVLNFAAIRGALLSVPKNVATKHARRGIYAGGVLIRESARSKVPVRTGALRSRIVSVTDKNRNGEITARVGIKKGEFSKGKRKGKNPRRYAHLVELGTIRTAAKPFLRPALDTNVDAILETVAAKIREGIAKETRG